VPRNVIGCGRLAVDGAAFSLLCVAGVAPACALAEAFAKARANPSNGPAIRSIVVSFWFDDSKTHGAAGLVPPPSP
jgi:hypothetical protein